MKRNTIIITTVSFLVLGTVGFAVYKVKKRKPSENPKINGIREETTVENAVRTGRKQQEEELKKAEEAAENAIINMF